MSASDVEYIPPFDAEPTPSRGPAQMFPQSLEAERAVLGSILIDPESMVKVISFLKPEDFYREAHGWLYAAMLALVERRTPIDNVTLVAELEQAGRLGKVGGPAFVTRMIEEVPTSLYIEHYGRIVEDLAAKRRLITAGGKIAELAFANNQPIETLIDQASQAFTQAITRSVKGGPEHVGGITQEVINRIDFLANNPGMIAGVPTGYAMLDRMLGGLQKSDLIILAGRPGMGKCLGKGTKVVMYDGSLKAVEDVKVGDQLMGPDSKPRNVLSLARGQEMMYWVHQNHGISYRVNESHILSLKRSKNEGQWRQGDVLNIPVVEAKDKGPGFFSRFKGYKVSVEFPEQRVSVDPYFLGLWLGDGDSDDPRVYTNDQEIIDYLHQYAAWRLDRVSVDLSASKTCPGYSIRTGSGGENAFHSLSSELRRMNLYNNKHIPQSYLINSRENRLKLLAGLIDSDGHYLLSQNGPYEITLKNQQLAQQIKFLCDSLGYSTSINTKRATIKDRGFACTVYRVRFNGNVDEIPVKIPRKKANPWCGFKDWRVTGITIEQDTIDEYYGFVIDGDHLFLLEDMTVTHNTAFALSIALNAAKRFGSRVAVFSLEMSKDQLVQRLLSIEAGIDSHRLRLGHVTESEWPALMEAANTVAGCDLYIDDTPAQTISEITTKARRLYAEQGLDLIVIDYMQLMSGSAAARSENRQQEISLISRSLKALARELNVPVLALSQLSRAVEQRADKRPTLSDLRESGAIEQDSDVVLFLYREDYYDENTDRQNVADVIVAKHRHGATGTISLYFRKELTQFSDLEINRVDLSYGE